MSKAKDLNTIKKFSKIKFSPVMEMFLGSSCAWQLQMGILGEGFDKGGFDWAVDWPD